MKNKRTKEKLIAAVLELSEFKDSLGDITSRDISSKSGINLALINYHFGSKDNLLRLVAEKKMLTIIESTIKKFDEGLPAAERINRLLIETASFAFDNINSFKIISRHELDVGCIHSIELFWPYFLDYLANIEEKLLRVIMLKLLVLYHSILLNPVEYGKVLGIDFFNTSQRNEFLVNMLYKAAIC